MMRIFLLVCILAISAVAKAQTAYPIAPPLPRLVQLEYFIDNDPGVNNRKKVNLTPSTNLSSYDFQADLSSLPSGFHRIFIRALDDHGSYSMTNHIFFDNYVVPAYPAGTAIPDLQAMEYFIDNDPGIGNATPLPLPTAADVAGHNVVINIAGVPAGVHRVFIRSRDAQGNWSITSFGQFDNTTAFPYPSSTAPAAPIQEMEYFIDTDPGLGNGIPVSFSSTTDLVNFSFDVPLNTITPGAHTFYIRSRQNPWSFTAYVPFLFSSTLPVSWLYVKGEIKSDQAFINWATAAEEGTDKFQIEHSTDGRNFSVIGETPAAGASSSTNHYQFIHNRPAKGMNYYRIKQLDKNGQFTYSKALHLLYRQDNSETIIAPNPVNDNLYIIAGTGQHISKMELYDLSGKQVLTKQFAGVQQVYSIAVSSLNKGIYIVKIYDGKTVTTQRILKQ